MNEESRPQAAPNDTFPNVVENQCSPTADIVIPSKYGLVIKVYKNRELRQSRANPGFQPPAPQPQQHGGHGHRGGQPGDDHLSAWLDPAEAEGRAS